MSRDISKSLATTAITKPATTLLTPYTMIDLTSSFFTVISFSEKKGWGRLPEIT